MVTKEVEQDYNEIDSLCGVFHNVADPDKIPFEKNAWADVAAEKHLKLLEEIKNREN